MKKKTKKIIRRPRWTRNEIAILKQLYKGRSNKYIAEILGFSVNRVIFKAFSLGLKKGPRRLRKMGQENIWYRWNPIKKGKRAA